MRSFKQIQELLGTPPEITDIKKIYLIGCTGAGKTSLVQHIIGSKSHKVKKLLNDVGKKLDSEVIFSKNKIIRSDHYKINPYSLKITKGMMMNPVTIIRTMFTLIDTNELRNMVHMMSKLAIHRTTLSTIEDIPELKMT